MNTRPRVAPTTNLLRYMCSPFGYIRLSFVSYFFIPLFGVACLLVKRQTGTFSFLSFFFSINSTKLRDKSQGLRTRLIRVLKFRGTKRHEDFLSFFSAFAIREGETNRNFAHRRRGKCSSCIRLNE